jgi:hypothetical protein
VTVGWLGSFIVVDGFNLTIMPLATAAFPANTPALSSTQSANSRQIRLRNARQLLRVHLLFWKQHRRLIQ